MNDASLLSFSLLVALTMLVRYNESTYNRLKMSTLTIRIEDDLKRKASKQAYQLGIPLTLVIKNALQNFIKNPSIVIGTPEIVDVTPQLQRKMDKIASILS